MILIIRQNLKLAHHVWRIGPNFCPLHHTILGSDKTDSSSKVNLQVKHVRRVLCAKKGWEICEERMLTTAVLVLGVLSKYGSSLGPIEAVGMWLPWQWLYKAKLLLLLQKIEIQKHKSKRQSQRLYNLIYVGSWCPEPSGRRTRGVALVLGIQRVRWPPGRWPLYEIPLDLHLSLLGGGNCLTCQ